MLYDVTRGGVTHNCMMLYAMTPAVVMQRLTDAVTPVGVKHKLTDAVTPVGVKHKLTDGCCVP